MKNFNETQQFNPLVQERLGHYVYALYYPDNKPFYVGKGGGKAGEGNARVLDHFNEASKEIKNKRYPDPDQNDKKNKTKIEIIHQIWETKNPVKWKILRYGLPDEDTAKEAESAIINAFLSLETCELTNIVRPKIFLDEGSVYKTFSDPFDSKALHKDLIGVPIFIFNITKMMKERSTAIDALEGNWRSSKKWHVYENAIAIGLVEGVSKKVVRVKKWTLSKQKKSEQETHKIYQNRYKFSHDPLETYLEKDLLRKDFKNVTKHSGSWNFGAWLVVKFREDGKLTFLKGKKHDAPIDLF